MAARGVRPLLHLRIRLGADRAFGPGKAALLEGIAAAGSIAAAGRAMRMSYKRAWQLVEEMNASFRAPLVEASKGGSHGGGARLTRIGEKVLALYRAVEARAADAPELAALLKLALR